MDTQEGQLHKFAEGLWTATIPASILGMKLTASMVVLQLSDKKLLLYSAIALTPSLQKSIEALGKIEHIYVPSLFHHMYAQAWAETYPHALVHAPVGLEKKQPNLRIDRRHGDPLPPGLRDILEEYPIEGCMLGESALLYKPKQALLVADLVHNVGQPQDTWTKLYTRMMGFYDRVALSRMLRWTSFNNKTAAKQSLEKILAQPFEDIIVGHGAPIQKNGKDTLKAAYQWLLQSK